MACSTFDFLNAAAYGTADEVRVMLDSGIDVNVRNEGSRETALMTAAGGSLTGFIRPTSRDRKKVLGLA